MSVSISQPLAIPATASSTRWIPAGARHHRHDVDFQPAIRLDAFHEIVSGRSRRHFADIQRTFSILIILQTWLSPLQGYLVDKFGPRLLIAVGCLLSGAGWITSAYATSLLGLYVTYGLLCGVGTGIVYIGIIGLMVRWFPDRRGFATGMVAAGYGFGAILTTFPIDTMLKSSGYQHTLVVFGIILGIVGAVAALAMRMPRSDDKLPPVSVMRRLKDVSAARYAAHESLLADVRHDDHDVDRRADDHFAIRFVLDATSALPRSWCSVLPHCRSR